ncbi:hypothetical protein F5Y19DRAFT_474048 [Xylariaceae sp. FL1651]|nr:hypothetical protein F5Y19DRAFT_474048 [Xylariaceae sp. FL1651]
MRRGPQDDFLMYLSQESGTPAIFTIELWKDLIDTGLIHVLAASMSLGAFSVYITAISVLRRSQWAVTCESPFRRPGRKPGATMAASLDEMSLSGFPAGKYIPGDR